jgi:hypothetical protein
MIVFVKTVNREQIRQRIGRGSMSTDFLTQIIKQKGREIAQARKVIPESRLAEAGQAAN